jgi:NIMA-interacting peptidyl-prolyl cis-trans isomerase 1
MVAASAVADLAAQALLATTTTSGESPPPEPLPAGWILKETRSQPGVFYYFHQVSGESMWEAPLWEEEEEQVEDEQPDDMVAAPTAVPEATAERKRSHEQTALPAVADTQAAKRPRKAPKEVRVLHILKKHKDSKRPASWRSNNQPITISLAVAREELEGLLEILREEASDPANLIATFEEFASQESDCSSAKRKGDLGMFGRKKMRAEFEEAAFGLDVNQLSGIVETASGAHILLRLE